MTMRRITVTRVLLVLVVGTLLPMTAAAAPNQNSSKPLNTSEQMDTIVKTAAPGLDIASQKWYSDRVVVVVDSHRPHDTVWIAESYGDDSFAWDSYEVDEGQTRLVYQFQEQHQDQVAVASLASKQGTVLKSPTASVFDRPARWSDHPITYVMTALAFLLVLVYRYKKRLYWENRELHSKLDN